MAVVDEDVEVGKSAEVVKPFGFCGKLPVLYQTTVKFEGG
jgi:hypothetical protein